MSETEKGDAAMLRLPDELVEKIIGYVQLPDVLVLERTCRWWFDAAILYWRKITVLDLVTFLRQKARLDIGNAFRCVLFDVSWLNN
jgi:hypothetical protein